MTEIETRLARLLAELAYREGDVVLSSGRRSSYYLDAKQVTYHPEGADLAGRAVLGLSREHEIDAIGGLTLGADAIVISTVLAARAAGLSLAGFIVRKEPKRHGMQRWIEGVLPERGARVAIVEDVVTSGESVLRAVAAARDAGLEVALVTALVDRDEGGAEAIRAAGLAYRPLFRISEIRELRAGQGTVSGAGR